jgi:hypothetical protein
MFFLGLVLLYRRLVPGFPEIAKPLKKLIEMCPVSMEKQTATGFREIKTNTVLETGISLT